MLPQGSVRLPAPGSRPDRGMAEAPTQFVELTDLVTSRRGAFGEFLVEHRAIDRFQLLRALQLQDSVPEAQLGECAIALGYAGRETIEQLHACFVERAAFDAQPTQSFEKDLDIEITWAP